MVEADRLAAAVAQLRQALLNERNAAGHWEGELATSALSTATAVSAMAVYQDAYERENFPLTVGSKRQSDLHRKLMREGIEWLARHQNDDGGWGDTDKSFSNIATTMLTDAAVRLAGQAEKHRDMLQRASNYLDRQGRLQGLRARYGKDKTFAVPILTNCALAGTARWSDVAPLPFEVSMLPRSLLGALQVPVVSYALPALIAIGQARFHHRKPWNPLLRFARSASVRPSLRLLETIQPESGGFLEATPLTSFVTMSLAGMGHVDHPVVKKGLEFIEASVRPNGSWPIDTNLATWVTTLSLNALHASGEPIHELSCWDWVLSCQHRKIHPYTMAAPGGWAWTDLSGGVPDADDSPGALLALAAYRDSHPNLPPERWGQIVEAAGWGVAWLLNLQNNDGGWPTFCKGWGALPFDRSGTDITAHVMRGLAAWMGRLAGEGPMSAKAREKFQQLDQRISQAQLRAFRYLAKQQQADGSWLALWFGNQWHPEEENPIYGTGRVLLAYRDLGRLLDAAALRGMGWLLAHQGSDGSWGGSWLAPENSTDAHGGTMEETAIAVQALLAYHDQPEVPKALERGLDWLLRRVEEDRFRETSPIGFYFAKLWYYERLYPLVFTLSALGSARQQLAKPEAASQTASPAATHSP